MSFSPTSRDSLKIMRISVLDNDTTQAELICQVLNGAGHSCQAFDSGKELLGQLRKDSTDLLIVDWQVTDVPAAELLRRAKEKLAPNTPTMFLAGSSAEDDIVAGVTAGADDYLVKPLRRGELVARTQALLRRAYPSQNGAEQLQFGPYVFETRPGRLMMDGEQLHG
jgi:DNA-binding response OmpR family regulator